MNQYATKTLRMPHASIAMGPTLLAHRILKTAINIRSGDRNTALQISTSSKKLTTQHENRSHYSTSFSPNNEDTLRSNTNMITKATRNVHSTLQKGLGMAPSLALSFPIAVVRTWRIDR